MTAPDRPSSARVAGRKPRDDELDVFGLTHTGKVRENNQDHFLIAALRKRIEVQLTSLPASDSLAGNERLAFLAMVADGVGGGPKGEEASRIAAEAITRYVTESMQCYYAADTWDDASFPQALEEAALHTHIELTRLAESDPSRHGMATTLTLWLGVWPRAYLLQVGDSRCYLLRNGELSQISRDQTLAQELFDQGIFTRTDSHQTRWAQVLASSIGGPATAPVVTRMDQAWGDVGLLCSDGLTKHVSDDQIKERLSSMTSARQACESLLQDALDDGGSDNVTILVGRSIRKDAA
jgi:serine/threonine protein phosphatase PrpC